MKAICWERLEVHCPKEIRAVLKAGQSPIEPIKGKTPINCLIEMYLRSPKFRDCVRVMLDAGAVIEDPVSQAVLLDDAIMLRRLMKKPGFKTERKFNLDCTFHPVKGCYSTAHLRRI